MEEEKEEEEEKDRLPDRAPAHRAPTEPTHSTTHTQSVYLYRWETGDWEGDL